MVTRVLLKVPVPTHAAYKIIAGNSPDGYAYVEETTKLYEQGNPFYKQVAKVLYKNPRLRDVLLLSRERVRHVNASPPDYSLVFSLGSYSAFNQVPTILFMEDAGAEVVKKSSIQHEMLRSGGIRRILVGNPAAARTFLGILSDAEYEDLVAVLRPGIPLPERVERAERETVNLLFVGSGNYSEGTRYAELDFTFRGGREMLSVFRLLNKSTGPSVRLTVVGVIPDRIAKEYDDVLRLGNVSASRRVIPKSELNKIYQESDIFLYPGYRGPWLTIGEAFSYGIPAVGSDTWDMPEYIEQGKNGVVVHRDDSNKVAMVNHKPMWNNDAIIGGGLDDQFVRDYAEAVSRLAEDRPYRARLGANARETVEKGIFSLGYMRAELRRYFDEALAGKPASS